MLLCHPLIKSPFCTGATGGPMFLTASLSLASCPSVILLCPLVLLSSCPPVLQYCCPIVLFFLLFFCPQLLELSLKLAFVFLTLLLSPTDSVLCYCPQYPVVLILSSWTCPPTPIILLQAFCVCRLTTFVLCPLSFWSFVPVPVLADDITQIILMMV